jgi:hypothetical protein
VFGGCTVLLSTSHPDVQIKMYTFSTQTSPSQSNLLPVGSDCFDPNIYPYEYPNNLIPIILPAYTAYEDGTECSETSAHKIPMQGNHPNEGMQHSENGESVNSRVKCKALLCQTH